MESTYTKMTIYKLKEVLDSQYNRTDEKRHHRSVLFLIQNTATGHQSLYEIDRISKHSAALRCVEKKCRARLSIEHDIQTEPYGSRRGRVIASSVLKEDLMSMENWLKVYHSHTLKCKMVGEKICDKVEHQFKSCESKTDGQIIGRKYRSYVIKEKVAKPHKSNETIIANADSEFNTLNFTLMTNLRKSNLIPIKVKMKTP